ncbi:MAG: ABC transporter ATP-binding protein [Candidatus Pristimantibacillus lignocellulolyticus]|uniref:ABC transporter ATP-binding protein n=1 Tax=Candidatus Pristimantibacillus lignocellulolyticus TaxID=2994561 RepID=A0A9J6ZJM2_9BACL|nr:MAG: ABC transporter ATP-binding protein [Candidatus Pristimantibacillus lignocellulolyticus]
MSLLRVENLTKNYGINTVVNNVSFTIEPFTSTALIGPNGAGKTTTMSMITGLLHPSSGKVMIEGSKDIREAIGFLPQYPQFYPWLSALEYVEMVANLSGVAAKEIRARSMKTLEYVGLGKVVHKKTSTFSGGMKQRLGIAQAIVHEPKLLLLDEPVSALDPIGRQEVMDLLKEIQQETTILYSTHILHDAEKMTDQVLFLKEGKLVEQGSLTDIQRKYAESKYLIQFASEQSATSFCKSTNGDLEQQGVYVYVNASEQFPSISAVMQQLLTTQTDIVKVERVVASLDQIFMKVAGVSEAI